MNDLDVRLRGALVVLVCAGAACTFPDIYYNITGAGGAGGSASTTTDSSNGGASTTSMGEGGAGIGGAGGAGGDTTATTGAGCTTDVDGDLHLAKVPCGGDDCNDDVFAVHGGQTNFFDTAIPETTDNFDYNCDAKNEGLYATDCPGALLGSAICPTEYIKFATTPPAPGCGVGGTLYACTPNGLTGCTKGSSKGAATQLCR